MRRKIADESVHFRRCAERGSVGLLVDGREPIDNGRPGAPPDTFGRRQAGAETPRSSRPCPSRQGFEGTSVGFARVHASRAARQPRPTAEDGAKRNVRHFTRRCSRRRAMVRGGVCVAASDRKNSIKGTAAAAAAGTAFVLPASSLCIGLPPLDHEGLSLVLCIFNAATVLRRLPVFGFCQLHIHRVAVLFRFDTKKIAACAGTEQEIVHHAAFKRLNTLSFTARM